MWYRAITPPGKEPVSLAAAKLHLRVDEAETSEDALIEEIITAAREYCEKITRRSIVVKTIEAYPETFPARARELRLPCPPLISVESIVCKDAGGTETEMAEDVDYVVDTVRDRIILCSGKSWPTPSHLAKPITIRYTVGYNADMAVPKTIRQAMLLLIGFWYTSREAVLIGSISKELELTVSTLLKLHRVEWW